MSSTIACSCIRSEFAGNIMPDALLRATTLLTFEPKIGAQNRESPTSHIWAQAR